MKLLKYPSIFNLPLLQVAVFIILLVGCRSGIKLPKQLRALFRLFIKYFFAMDFFLVGWGVVIQLKQNIKWK